MTPKTRLRPTSRSARRRSLVASTFCLLVGAFGLGACESREEKAVSLLEEMASTMEKHDGDCDKLANELTRLRKNNGDAMKALKETDKLSPDERKSFDAKYQKRIDKAMGKMVEHAMSCRDNPKIAEAMAVE